LLSFGPSFSEEISRSVIQAVGHENREHPQEAEVRIAAALTMLEAFHPRDHLECMLAAQGVVLHAAMMESLRRAMLPDMSEVLGVKLRSNAAQLGRAFSGVLRDLERLQSKALPQRPGKLPPAAMSGSPPSGQLGGPDHPVPDEGGETPPRDMPPGDMPPGDMPAAADAPGTGSRTKRPRAKTSSPNLKLSNPEISPLALSYAAGVTVSDPMEPRPNGLDHANTSSREAGGLYEVPNLEDVPDMPEDLATRPDGTPGSLAAYAPKPRVEVFIPGEPAIMIALATRPSLWRMVNVPAVEGGADKEGAGDVKENETAAGDTGTDEIGPDGIRPDGSGQNHGGQDHGSQDHGSQNHGGQDQVGQDWIGQDETGPGKAGTNGAGSRPADSGDGVPQPPNSAMHPPIAPPGNAHGSAIPPDDHPPNAGPLNGRGPLDPREHIFTGDALSRFASARFDPDAPIEPLVFEDEDSIVELELISTGGDPEGEAERARMIAAHPEGKPIVTFRHGSRKPQDEPPYKP
jgi:hypothetical protein